jgi:MFS family permease
VRAVPRVVWVLGAASLLNDASSEMVYPLLPAFLTGPLGAGLVVVGLIEGVAEATASTFKVLAGSWTDRLRRRKPFVLAGYALSNLARPLIAFAGAWTAVLGLRFLDRVGKGVRTPPRDALIADATDPSARGAAFGVHRALDHAGAVLGPLAAALLLLLPGVVERDVFLIAAIPGVAAVAILLVGVREEPVGGSAGTPPAGRFLRDARALGPGFGRLLVATLVFVLGRPTEMFLLFRMKDVGVPVAWVAVLWALLHVVKAAGTWTAGPLTDRFGRRPLLVAGWLWHAVVFAGFGWLDSPTALVALFLAYGLHFGLVEPAERAWVADLVPARLRGTAFGCFHLAVGVGALPAGVLFGLAYQEHGAVVPFLGAAALAVAATALVLTLRPARAEAER